MKKKDINFIWIYEVHRGPLSGLVEWKGKTCWFDCWRDPNRVGGTKAVYEIFSLTNKQLLEVEKYRILVENLRSAKSYGPEGVAEFNKVYDQVPNFVKVNELDNLQVVGTFVLEREELVDRGDN